MSHVLYTTEERFVAVAEKGNGWFGPGDRPGCFGGKNLVPLLRIEPQFFGHPTSW
jgi:hypothetical protein